MLNFIIRSYLQNKEYNFAREYLKKRNLSKKEVVDFKIGYVPHSPNFFEKY